MIMGRLRNRGACVLVPGFSLGIRNRRFRRLALRVCLTALVTVALATWWLWSDKRGMAAFERYTWSGWYLVVIPGAFVIGALACMIRIVRSVFRLMWRPRWRAVTNRPS
jgi:hypothetical protein